MEPTDTIGFVGLGSAGWRMAALLTAAGNRLIVHDVDAELTARFVAEHDARAAATAADVGEADIVFTMLPHGGIVREVLLGDGGLADRLREGSIVVDTSSSDPNGTRALADELAPRGIALIDAGVSVPRIGGLQDHLTNFMVGADDERALERVRPLLQAMGPNVFVMGRTGTGHATKTLNNYVSAAGLYGALDGLIVGQRFGLDAQTMMDVLNVSTGRNFSTEQTIPVCSLPRRYECGYTLPLLAKDLAQARDFIASLGLDTEMGDLLVDGFRKSVDDLGDADISASLVHWEHVSGTEIPSTADAQEVSA